MAAEIFAGFEDVDPRSMLGGGDVKYHLGATSFRDDPRQARCAFTWSAIPATWRPSIPSPWVACAPSRPAAASAARPKRCPSLMHGDSAFAGQGITAETLNLADLRGYSVGGTVHIIVNNLLGFTTNPGDTVLQRFASPTWPSACRFPSSTSTRKIPRPWCALARLAVEYRYQFGSDVVIDLIGYRRHGHSRSRRPDHHPADRCIRKIKDHPPLYQIYAAAAAQDASRRSAAGARSSMQQAKKAGAAADQKKPSCSASCPSYWAPFHGGTCNPADEVDTGLLPAEVASSWHRRLTQYPEDFHIHPKVQKLLEQRREMAEGKRPLDYGMAEALAFGSLALSRHRRSA